MQPPAMDSADVDTAMARAATMQIRCPDGRRCLYAADTVPTGADGEALDDPAAAVWGAAGCLAEERTCPCATEPDVPQPASATPPRTLPEGVTLTDIGPIPSTPPAPAPGAVPTLAGLPTLGELETPAAVENPGSLAASARAVLPLGGVDIDALRAHMTVVAAHPIEGDTPDGTQL